MAAILQEVAPLETEATYADHALYRLSIEQFEKMVVAGILTTDDRCILLDGVLVAKMSKGDPHTTTILISADALRAAIPPGWHVRTEAPVAIPDGPGGFDSVPEPDLSIARGHARDYVARKPRPSDLALVVEVADSSLAADRKKIARYARAEIPSAWIINLEGRVIEAYSDPIGHGDDAAYREFQLFAETDEIPLFLDGDEVGRVAVRHFLP